MWVEFLLKESASSATPVSPSAAPSPLSPSLQQHFNFNGLTSPASPPLSPNSPTRPLVGERRISSTGPRTLRMQSMIPTAASSPSLLSGIPLLESATGIALTPTADSDASLQSTSSNS